MPDRITSFKITDQNSVNLAKVANNEDRSHSWVINKALEIYLNNKLGINARKRGK